ncbi:MAG: malto-oligosyltrehalose synthase, partial [Candidatus Eisenbacteria bacterium]|nr:malto-oligosyltrehalose synthase [Candidatus Eisenbacteria bacterium]
MTDRRAVYRLQLSPSFAFGDAAGLGGYLAGLGVSHVHLSPCLEARGGSPHGYDVVDPTRIRRELGGDTGFEELVSSFRSDGLGVLLDFVPNHMAASHENPWWWDVLLRGRESRYARYFDIDWYPPQPELAGKVLIPVLPCPLAEALERGDIGIAESDGGRTVTYGDLLFPIAEGSLRESRPGRRALADLLARQHYVLAHWARGPTQLNYRRFANVPGLVGVRVEDEEVFEAMHAKVLDLLDRGLIDGLRIDHVDGLRDPAGYLERLRSKAPGAWIVVEKILTRDERLRREWPVEGTTGYDFLNLAGGLFVDQSGEAAMSELYEELTGASASYAGLEREKKLLVLDRLFPAELGRLSRAALRLRRLHAPELDGAPVAEAVRELLASFPVYRTYVRADAGSARRKDAERVDEAIRLASEARRDLGLPVWTFLRDLLLLRYRGGEEADFAARFQQLTGPVTAKGVEDTAFYCFNRLISLNEVGGDPG